PEMFNKLKKTNGITLIALIISVIVLLILAGVAINVTVGENGVLTQATTAVKKNKKAKVLEDVKLAWTGIKADYYAKWSQNSGVQFSQIVNKIVLQKYLEGTVNSLEKTGEREYTLDYTENDKEESRYIILLDEEGNAEFSEELIIPETLELEITNGEEISKESKKIKATLMNLEEPVNWIVKSGAEKISLSNAKGKEIIVTAEAEGEAIIQATCGKHTKKCTVTVNVVTPIRSIDSISGEPTINLNDEFPQTILTANVTPEGATESSLIWESLNEDIAEVTNVNGRIATITGNSVGTATIKVSKRGEEETVFKTTDIEVIQPIPVTGITIKKVENEEEIELSANETITMNPSTSGNTQTKTLKAYVVPTDASNKNITWSIVSGEGVVSLPSITAVESGTEITVTSGESAGSAVLRATTVDGNHTADITVNVQVPLKIGDEVTYEPSHTTTWNGTYATMYYTGNKTLSSANGESFRITSWRVLSIDKETEEVELISTAPTSGKVTLGGAQGYNNGVKLLNDACNALYEGKITKGYTEYIITTFFSMDVFRWMKKETLLFYQQAKEDIPDGI
ncbi:MAG: Ig-like domain-containing protein, partial [Lachnospiraceae bacterium]|nr:Ig-like domain-containing protein [Lachnospiraceae bacterium]